MLAQQDHTGCRSLSLLGHYNRRQNGGANHCRFNGLLERRAKSHATFSECLGSSSTKTEVGSVAGCIR